MEHEVPAQLLGLPDDLFEPRRPGSGVITKREVRAVALAALGVHRSAVVWDVGSGTGSVAIEAARLASAGQVYAIERDEGALAAIQNNCRRLGASNVTVVPGRAPEVLAELPAPDAIFIGGSGGALLEILDAAMMVLHPGGRLVVNLATIEHLTEAARHLRQRGWSVECTLVSVARSAHVLDVTRFAALNPVFILTASSGGAGASLDDG